MKTLLKGFALRYVSDFWLPGGIAVVVALCLAASAAIPWWSVKNPLITTFYYAFLVSIAGMLIASLVSFVRRRWLGGFMNLLLIPFVLIVTVVAAMFSSSGGDHFADNLTIPDNIAITTPKEFHSDDPDLRTPAKNDHLQIRLSKAFSSKHNDDPTVTADISSLVNLSEHHPNVLSRYLACSPYWRVFEERGSKFATRRWFVGPHWHYPMHGYYSNFNQGFQTRCTIGFSNKPWARASRESTYIKPGETKKLKLEEGNQLTESHCILDADDFVVEVFEQSSWRERFITKVTLAQLEDEFGALAASPRWETIQRMVESIQSPPGKPSIMLRNSFQPGIYESEIWANPGEPGKVYLKAYEVTHNTRLSDEELENDASEWIGWSDNPNELFLSNTHFSISEGDWDKPYAARFEVWFVPDSGKPERKLMQRTFKIEGWMR